MRTTSGTCRFTRLAGRDHAGGDRVALHDAAKDVDQDGLDLLVLEHDLEGFGDLLGRGAAAHVQEVGRLGAKQLDGVHGGHGQTGAIDQAADVAVQADVGQVELRGLDFGRVFFVQVAQGHDFRVAEQRVAVEVELGVQRNDVALAIAVQRVDFNQRGVGVHIALVELLADVDELRLRVGRHADGVRQSSVPALRQSGQRVDELGDDLLGRGVGHFLDVHAAFTGRNEARPSAWRGRSRPTGSTLSGCRRRLRCTGGGPSGLQGRSGAS
jgi:hypothetical protein